MRLIFIILNAFTLESKKKGAYRVVCPKLKTELGLLRRSALFRHLRLFTGGSVFVEHALSGGMINGADGFQIRFFAGGGITGLQCLVETADGRLHLGSGHAVAKILLFGNLSAFNSGLDVCQNNSPPVSVSKFTRTDEILAYTAEQCKKKIRIRRKYGSFAVHGGMKLKIWR